MQSALVLNATYEPLSVVPVRRAVCLVLSEKAEILHDDGTEVRSARRCVARPLVVRLRGITWSMESAWPPQYWQQWLSRAKTARRDSAVRRWYGTFTT